MKDPNFSYIKDDINGQFGAHECVVIINGKVFEIDLQPAHSDKIFEVVRARGREVKQVKETVSAE